MNRAVLFLLALVAVLFAVIVERYERKSIDITTNIPFSAQNDAFPDKVMT